MSVRKAGYPLFRVPILDYFVDLDESNNLVVRSRESSLIVEALDEESAIKEERTHHCYIENFIKLEPESRTDILPFKIDFSRKIHHVHYCHLRYVDEEGNYVCEAFDFKEFCCIEQESDFLMRTSLPDFEGCPYYPIDSQLFLSDF